MNEREAQRWQRIDALFAEALEREPDERRVFLEEACPDPSIREEVGRLLDAGAAADQLFSTRLEQMASPIWSEVAGTLSDDLPGAGQRLGAYRIIRQLARGGMGTVFLAERDDGRYEQRVALKILHRSTDSEPAYARFLAERRILASLEHPGIARLLDGGETETGQPYLVMEYVDGEPIDRYCDTHRLTIEERLRLFIDVCHAVGYAHRNLIVHRDIKPSNVLVTADGHVKLLDFGIAKLLDEGTDSSVTPQTRTGVWLLTPEYASPEQLRGEPVTTASDVYQLGLLLFDLVAGTPPFSVTGTMSPAEIERLVCETSPPTPSSLAQEAAVAAARARDTTPATLHRTLRGDLDTIALTALRKEPERRYESAMRLADDIERHLEHRPITARPETVRYRVRKYVRRNRGQALLGLVIALLILGYTVTVTAQARLLRQQHAQTQLEASRAEQVTELLAELFSSADPRQTDGEAPSVRDVLDRGAERIRSDDALTDQPAVRAHLAQLVGRIYRRISNYAEADAILRTAVDELTDAYGPDHERTAEAMATLAAVQANLGRFGEADSLYTHARNALERTEATQTTVFGQILNGLAEAHAALGDYEASAAHYEEAARVYAAVSGEDHPYTATVIGNWGQTLIRLGELEAAEDKLRESLRIRRVHHGERHPDIAYTLARLGRLMNARGELERADSLLESAIAIQREVYDGDHTDIATALEDLARVREAMGDLVGAEAHARESLAISERMTGPESYAATTTASNLARILHGQGRHLEGAEIAERVLEIKRRDLGDEHPDITVLLYNLASMDHAGGRLDRAEAGYRDVVARDSARLGGDHVEVAIDRGRLAAVLRDQGRLDEAEAVFRQALATLRRDVHEDHPRIAESALGLGSTLTLLGRAEEALPLLDEALGIRDGVFQDPSWQIAEARMERGRALGTLGRYTEAEPLLRDGYRTLLDTRGADDTLTRRALDALQTLEP